MVRRISSSCIPAGTESKSLTSKIPTTVASRSVRTVVASPFVRNVALLTSGTAAGQVITALATPALSRLYSPAELGVFALFLSVVSILSEVASGGYELAVVLPRDDDDAINVLALAGLCVCATVVITLLAVALGGGWAAGVLKSPSIGDLLWWAPPALLAIGLARCLGSWGTRAKRFSSLTLSHGVRALGIVVVQVGAGFAGTGAAGLVGGRVWGEITALGALSVSLRDLLPRLASASWARMKRLAAEYSDFPRYNLPQSLINSVSQSIPTLLLAAYFDATVVGIYAMANRLLVLPSRLISQPVRQVFLQKAAETKASDGRLFPLLVKATAGLAAVVIVPVVVVMIWGPWIFGFFLGDEWTSAGHYARWLVLWLFFVYVNPPAITLGQVLRKNHYMLVYDIALLAFRAAAIVIGGTRLDALTTIALFSIVGAVFNAGWITFMLVLSQRTERTREP